MEKVSLAKRLNNDKRGYLIINENQGKHKIALIDDVKNEYYTLADLAGAALKDALVIGFAETAIAVGATLASSVGAFFMQTTREDICAEDDYIHFTEAHSHATNQRLVYHDLKEVYNKVDRIVFAEDEITTGNTIWNCIEEIESIFKGGKNYAVATLIDTLSEDKRDFFKERNVDIISIRYIDKEGFEEDVLNTVTDGDVYSIKCRPQNTDVKEISFKTDVRTRRLLDIKKLDAEIERLIGFLEEKYKLSELLQSKQTVTVLGTEEFIYVPLKLAEYMDAVSDAKVYVHSSTRSPIEVSKSPDYPLHVRYEVKSIFDRNRRTYIYDLKKSDIFFLVTDGNDKDGEEDILEAIRLSGNENIHLIRWDNEEQLQK